MRFDSRLRKAEQCLRGDIPSTVQPLIGKYYDELDQKERNQWTRYYYGMEADYFEQIEKALFGGDANYHFVCEQKPPAPSQAELGRRIEIVQKYLNNEVGADALDW